MNRAAPADLCSAVEVARRVMTDEADALRRAADALGPGFEQALRVLLDSQRILITGLGKSGIIGRKIAATLTSTGSPAIFMHPVEALHGDLGLVAQTDCLLALSRSGNTEEVLRFVTHFRRLGGRVIAVMQTSTGRLAELAHHVLPLPDAPEAGPLSLAPTTSCVLQLSLGDAIAMALLHARGFAAEDFARYHPEGSLGRRLLLRAEDLMFQGDRLPVVSHAASMNELLLEITRKQIGLALILHADGSLLGTFTDGDLRRLVEREANWRSFDAAAAHARSRRSLSAPPVRCSTVNQHRPAVDCLETMRESLITSLVVVDEAGKPVGVLRQTELLAAGLA